MHSMSGAGHTCNLHLLTYLLIRRIWLRHLQLVVGTRQDHGDATAQRQPPLAICLRRVHIRVGYAYMGAGLVQAVFDGVHCTGHFLAWHRLTAPNFAFPSRRRFNSSAVFVSCSRHSVRSRTRLELGKRAFTVAAIAAWKSPWRCPERANTWQIQTVTENPSVYTVTH